MPQRQVSEAGVKLVMEFEGYRRGAARLPDGRWTIGYGHTLSARAGAQVSEADARALLLYDLRAVATTVESVVFTPLNQNQFDALACFAFNIGLENFRLSSVLRLVNEAALLQAAYALEHWRRAEIDGEALVVDGLVRRRAAEKALFLTPASGWTAVPSAVVQPRLDHDPGHHGLNGHPVELHAELTGEVARAERIGPPPEPVVAAIFPPEVDMIEPFPAPPLEPVVEALAVAIADESAHAETWIGRGRHAAPVLEPIEPSLPPVALRRAPLRSQFGEFDYTVAEPETGGHWPWIGLGLVGVVVFAASIFWALSAKGQAGPFSPQVIGTLMALAGVACVVCAVYSLIQGYLGRDD
jgi:lysozyme